MTEDIEKRFRELEERISDLEKARIKHLENHLKWAKEREEILGDFLRQ